MHPLVAVEKTKHVATAAERHGFGSPCESETVPALAPRGEDHGLVERPKGHRHLKHDASLLELAQCRKVRPGAIPEGLDDDLVVPRAREALQDAKGLSV